MSEEKQIEKNELQEFVITLSDCQHRYDKECTKAIVTKTDMPKANKFYAKYLMEHCYRKQEWISVDERLPEETCECLAVSKCGTISLVNYSNRYKAFNATDDYNDGDRWKFNDVTHWMPLPEAPKMKGGAE